MKTEPLEKFLDRVIAADYFDTVRLIVNGEEYELDYGNGGVVVKGNNNDQ